MRANRELGVQSVITGRRASQGAARATLQPLEVDGTGLLKLNPLFSWNFSDVQTYLDANNVPRNALLAQGYKSVGDWHSTQKSGDGDAGERAGRWAGREEKTECGLHVDYFAQKLAQKRAAEVRAVALAFIAMRARADDDLSSTDLAASTGRSVSSGGARSLMCMCMHRDGIYIGECGCSQLF